MKIHFWSHFTLDRAGTEPLARQLVRQVRGAVVSGKVDRGAKLPSTRALARALGISRNTAIAAYDELTSLGLVQGRRGSGVYVSARSRVDPARLLSEAQYPTEQIEVSDPDGNRLHVCDVWRHAAAGAGWP